MRVLPGSSTSQWTGFQQESTIDAKSGCSRGKLVDSPTRIEVSIPTCAVTRPVSEGFEIEPTLAAQRREAHRVNTLDAQHNSAGALLQLEPVAGFTPSASSTLAGTVTWRLAVILTNIVAGFVRITFPKLYVGEMNVSSRARRGPQEHV